MPISKNSPPIFQHYNGKWRPLWRGRVHGIAALVAIPAGTLLILAAESAIAGGGTPAEYGAYVAREQARWKDVVIKGQIRPG